MPYPIHEKLVVAVSSSALFDLRESDRVFREQGEEEYRRYQRRNEDATLNPGVAFPFIKRLLQLNSIDKRHQPIEVVLLSRNDPDTGLRVFKSIEKYKLGISRAAFVTGRNPYKYMDSFNASLFLSSNPADVNEAISRGLPAGLVFNTRFIDDEEAELRIAFDFDGVLADDSAEQVFQETGELSLFHQHEKDRAREALGAGPLKRFFSEIAKLQRFELERKNVDPEYTPKIRTAIVTARNAPAHERVVTTLRDWGIRIDEAFFLGGIDKSRILNQFRPHIFFDDQVTHIRGTAEVIPSVHIPFGVTNRPAVEQSETTSQQSPA
ncbi:MAG TPA: 5'-nucleotidase [Longimicrobiaceae bacterium]